MDFDQTGLEIAIETLDCPGCPPLLSASWGENFTGSLVGSAAWEGPGIASYEPATISCNVENGEAVMPCGVSHGYGVCFPGVNCATTSIIVAALESGPRLNGDLPRGLFTLCIWIPDQWGSMVLVRVGSDSGVCNGPYFAGMQRDMLFDECRTVVEQIGLDPQLLYVVVHYGNPQVGCLNEVQVWQECNEQVGLQRGGLSPDCRVQ